MDGNFQETTIGEVCSVGDGAHAKVTRQETGILYLTSKNIGSGCLKLDTVDYISEQDFEKLFPKNSRAVSRLKPGDVLIGIIGTFGNAYRYKESDYFGISSSVAILRPDPSILDSDFLYYVVTSKTFKDTHTAYKSGSVQGYTNIPTIKSLPITLPPLDEQKAIAHILSTLDDKIELNQQINHTLESIARALFKSWFIDFEPVRAKMDGRQPAGMDAETAALFPDEFEDSTLGKIPKGWQIVQIEDIAARVAMGPFGSRITSDNFVPSGVPVIRGNNLSDGFIENGFVYLTEEKTNELKSSVAYPGDLVFTHRGTLGQVGLIPESAAFPRYVVSQSQMLLSVDRQRISSRIIYYFFSSPIGQQALLANTNTTGVPSIARPSTSLKAIQLVIPPKTVSDQFDQFVSSLESKREQNVQEITSLTSIRDCLLPKLLSGQLQVI